ncbi:hypothetical protein NP493_22g03013 [Ridgeia piscesae]|uniref:Uncharacterized protein n=1 Tax=Ridgeia piscesae TaxID=27915 RepID=A0AAD9UKL6_RIDPI|nr:hypothetical protein NP493_22g03013 [Ridgeia piscesae]
MDTTSLGSQGDFPSDYPSLASEPSAVSRNDVDSSSSESEARIRENKLQKAKDDRVKKSKKCWKILQKSVHSAINIVQDSEIEEISINHGVHHERSISHAKPIQHVIYNPKTMEYISLDGLCLRIFLKDGKKKSSVTPIDPFDRLIYAAPNNLYVGWNNGGTKMQLLDSALDVVSCTTAPGRILCAIYNEHTNEIIASGQGFITVWVFRYGGRYLLPKKTIKDGMTSEDEFNILALEQTPSKAQRLFAAEHTTIKVFNLREGKLLSTQTQLHVRKITAMIFFNPLKFLVTGSKDGSIKVWDDQWHLQLVFVGHSGPVTSVMPFPYGPHVISSSLDCTIRVWSLETCDQVDKVDTAEPVMGLDTQINRGHFFSYGGTRADLWTVRNIHNLHSIIGHTVFSMQATSHPQYPIRNVLLCNDSSVRIMSPTTGDIITSLLMPIQKRLVDAAYAIAEDVVFAVFANGHIIKADTSTNPCTVMAEWKSWTGPESCNYLLVYEYVITDDFEKDTWAGMKRAIVTRSIHDQSSGDASVNRTLLLGGRKDGCICVFNWETGAIDFKIEAHGTKGVLSMVASSKTDQLISSGLDNVIKIWRLFPYAQESLAPLMSFYCAHLPIYMSVMKKKLAVAFQEHITATYSVVLYNISDKDRYDHPPTDDHMDSITGLTTCPKMKFVASSSQDGTIHIWNEFNHLVRQLKLSETPHSLCFCSERGDLLVGIGKHIHKINYQSYMPVIYQQRLITKHFRTMPKEDALPYNESHLMMLKRDDQKRLRAARASFKYTHFVDVLTTEENDELMDEKQIKEQAYAKLEERELELAMLRNGQLKPTRKKKKPTPKTQREAFNKYLALFYNRPDIEVPKDEDFEKELREKERQKKLEDEGLTKWRPEVEPVGFFPDKALAIRDKTQITLRPDGFVPNSILVRLIWPQTAIETQREKKKYTPPEITEFYDSIAKPKPVKRKQEDEDGYQDRTLILDSDEDEELVELESEAPSAFMQKMQAEMKKPPTPLPVEEPEERPVTPKKGSLPKQQKPRKAIVKHVSAAPVPNPPTPPKVIRERKPSVVGQPSALTIPHPPAEPIRAQKPESPGILPYFITQFKGEGWFDSHFPDCSVENMPGPWEVGSFVNLLLGIMKTGSFVDKAGVAKALIHLHKEEGLLDLEGIYKTVYDLLNPRIIEGGDATSPPSCENPDEKMFLQMAIQLLHFLGVHDLKFFTETLVQLLEGDKDLRTLILSLLRKAGLNDPTGQLVKEVDGWDIWNIDKDRANQLRRMSQEWLVRQKSKFSIHLEMSIETLKKGHQLHGQLSGSAGLGSSTGGRASILKRGGTGTNTVISAMLICHVAVVFNDEYDPDMLQKISYMEAINHFCEMTSEREVPRGELPPPMPKERHVSPEGVKNTVLVLPKIIGEQRLVRLGETHVSRCRGERETALADMSLPPIIARGWLAAPGQLYGFPPVINLPMKSLLMNPFPTQDELLLQKQSTALLMLHTSQKYFIHTRSYVSDLI